MTYTLTVANAGPNVATAVAVSDAVPAGFVFVSADPRCTFDAGTASVACALGDLADGASTDVTITLRPQAPNAGQTVRNTATVTGDQPDPDLRDNTSGADVDVEPEADLAIVKSANSRDRAGRRHGHVHAAGVQRRTQHGTGRRRRGPAAGGRDRGRHEPEPGDVRRGRRRSHVPVRRASPPAVRRRRRSPSPSPRTPPARRSSTRRRSIGGIFDPRLKNNRSTVSTTVTAIDAAACPALNRPPRRR